MPEICDIFLHKSLIPKNSVPREAFCCTKPVLFFIDAAKQRMDTDFCFLFTHFFFIFLRYAIGSFSECYDRVQATKAPEACKPNAKS